VPVPDCTGFTIISKDSKEKHKKQKETFVKIYYRNFPKKVKKTDDIIPAQCQSNRSTGTDTWWKSDWYQLPVPVPLLCFNTLRYRYRYLCIIKRWEQVQKRLTRRVLIRLFIIYRMRTWLNVRNVAGVWPPSSFPVNNRFSYKYFTNWIDVKKKSQVHN
jgi:hypothetical protein